MKRILCLSAGLGLILLTGCITLSVYPYYTAKDLTFDAALIGVWSDPGQTNADGETWTFERGDEQTYRLTVRDDDRKTEFDARLFKLKGHLFLDCLPRARTEYFTPGHVLLRVDRLQPRLEMRLLDYEWIGELIEKNPKAIRHAIIPKSGDHDPAFVLTADTAELQKFVLKHIATADAWKEKVVLQRR